MPFTLAHGAAALPLRRLCLVPSALLVGTFAPDFEYFLRFAPDDKLGHTLTGTFVLTLPLALGVLWLFHAYVKLPMARLLPDGIQRRLTNHLHEFRFGGAVRFAQIVGAVLLGIATHLAWDSFTHPNTWLYQYWPFLSQTTHLPMVGRIPFYKLFQHGSTAIGLAVLSAWFVLWYRNSERSCLALSDSASPRRKVAFAAIVTTIAMVGAGIRVVAGIGIPNGHPSKKQLVGLLVVTAIALAWWQLVAYGIFSKEILQEKYREG